MSSQGSNNNGSSKGANDSYSTGTNPQGNHWCHRGPSEASGVYTPPSENPRTSR
ncbi:11594_t:CDS:2 [Dentiscutata erythropus]|uniref:11594_t:CDS:1 n=1 Tax=Dentiscutata erythropus TaxID=1348616 RepID=A0A9N9JMF5_9GLOM|nr:11594_t:CDS:2 [Dentiscutata erythropus]